MEQLKIVLEKVTRMGKFGENCTFLDVVISDVEGEDHFASDVTFAKVTMQHGKGDKVVNVVIKLQKKDPFTREMMNTDCQFYNEFVMYDNILPFLEKNEIVEKIFPKLIYGYTSLGENYENDILIVEDLRQYDYKLTDIRLFLDFDHCALALKKLGQFHALSYCKKQENLIEFYNKIQGLKEVRVDKDKDETNRFFRVSMERGILPVVEADGNSELLERFKDKLEDPFTFMKGVVQPEEPVAVICHGDFCRNNMMFKYDDAGKPVDVRFFDVATARYASPAIDLSFFLFMNTSAELREAHWGDLVKVYHDALASAVPGTLIPTLDDIHTELKKKATYGYILCSFFIPLMMESKPKDLEDIAILTLEEQDEINRTQGGDLATKYISEIVRHLVKLNSV